MVRLGPISNWTSLMMTIATSKSQCTPTNNTNCYLRKMELPTLRNTKHRRRKAIRELLGLVPLLRKKDWTSSWRMKKTSNKLIWMRWTQLIYRETSHCRLWLRRSLRRGRCNLLSKNKTSRYSTRFSFSLELSSYPRSSTSTINSKSILLSLQYHWHRKLDTYHHLLKANQILRDFKMKRT